MIKNSRELQSITNNFLAHIFSREFDFEGYWGVGAIYHHANLSKRNNITFDLTVPRRSSDSILKVAQTYFQNWITTKTASASTKEQFVKRAFVHFEFRELPNPAQIDWDIDTFRFKGAKVAWVLCTVVVISKNDRVFVKTKSSYCAMKGTGNFQRRGEDSWGIRR